MKKFLVNMPIEVDGKTYRAGAEVDLDEATAKLYKHAISLVTAKEEAEKP